MAKAARKKYDISWVWAGSDEGDFATTAWLTPRECDLLQRRLDRAEDDETIKFSRITGASWEGHPNYSALLAEITEAL